MSNEELMRRLADGDASALDELCKRNMGLIRSRARQIAVEYHCEGQKETLSDLESEGMEAFFKCISSGKYDESKGLLTTYAVPFIDGAIRRFAKAELRHAGMLVDDGGEELERYDVENVGDSLDEIVHRKLETEKMRRCFDSLSKREKDIIGKCFGAYDYPKESLRDIAMYHMIKEDAVKKAKRRVQKKLLEMYYLDE